MEKRADQFHLDRFLDAQADVYPQALQEIRRGRKRSHWMWFVFPQLRGLGRSPTSQYFGIRDLEEARAYLAHPVLGARLKECADALLRWNGNDAHAIFGSPDDLKLRSSLTLFAAVSPPGSVFEQLLDKYFDGQADPNTLQRLTRVEGNMHP